LKKVKTTSRTNGISNMGYITSCSKNKKKFSVAGAEKESDKK
jgi:hypothetical protein